MKNYNKIEELEGNKPPGFFSGCPEQEFHMEILEQEAQKIEEIC